MSNEKDTSSLPPEAKRRGGMDTLFSAAWFDEDAAKASTGSTPPGADRAGGSSVEAEAPPKKSSTLMYVVIAVVVLGLLGVVGCTGVAGLAGAWYYYSLTAAAVSG